MTRAAADPPILNLADVALESHPRPAPGALAERFEARFGRIGEKIGARQLGYNVTVVPPGKRAFPHHNHRVNEEMFLVLEGNGELRLGERTFPIRAGDVIACPAGGQDAAHQIINTGDAELRYLAVSTLRYPEICDYPDSGKFGVTTHPHDPDAGTPFRHVDRAGTGLDYWDGE
jgi:uncharacterized cupin superfamily protein